MLEFNDHKIVLVEDDKNDVFLSMLAFKEIGLEQNVIVLKNGEEAINYIIKRQDINGSKYSPGIKLVLLDLRMPKVDGYQVLESLKCYPPTAHIPVVILATAGEDPDIKRCRDMGANSYIEKPVTADEFMKVVGLLGNYWLRVDKF